MRELEFRWIFNVAYSPEYNPIELTFSMLKKNFKALRAQKLLGLRQESHEALVALAVSHLKNNSIPFYHIFKPKMHIFIHFLLVF